MADLQDDGELPADAEAKAVPCNEMHLESRGKEPAVLRTGSQLHGCCGQWRRGF